MRAVRQRQPAEPVHRSRHHGKAHLDRRHHPAPGHPLPHLEIGEPLRVGLEPVGELGGATHGLAEQDPRHRQRLLDDAREVGQRLLGRLRDPPPLVADAPREQDEHGDQREREQRQLPVQGEHADHRRQHGRHVRDDRGGGGGDDALDAADVVRDPRLHLARAGAREERERELLQMPEDGGAQVVHHALADLVREQRLPDAEHARDDRDRDHAAGEIGQPRRVRVPDRDQHAAQQERRDHAERGREHDQHEHGREPPPVRHEEPRNAPRVRPPHGRIGRPLGRLGGAGAKGTGHQIRVRTALPEPHPRKRDGRPQGLPSVPLPLPDLCYEIGPTP